MSSRAPPFPNIVTSRTCHRPSSAVLFICLRAKSSLAASKLPNPQQALNALPSQNIVGVKGLWGSDWVWWLEWPSSCCLSLLEMSVLSDHQVQTWKGHRQGKTCTGSGLTGHLASLVRPGRSPPKSGCPMAEQEHTGEQETEMLS